MFYTIKKWAPADRPRERVRTLGVRALATRELLALLIETGRQERDGVPARTAVELAGDLLAVFAAEDGDDTSDVLGLRSPALARPPLTARSLVTSNQ